MEAGRLPAGVLPGSRRFLRAEQSDRGPANPACS